MNDDRNAKADALAGELRRQNSGHLTVFLGAAPGVGKTYAMLSRARELRRQGIDLVVGIVETHGRSETAALVDGLELIPRRRIEYQSRKLQELDVDAILARRPQVALIDELAHRNVPGSRHERRWQDVIDLLDAGIDVYTTINIQHLESLNDVVHRITGIRVSETVPDAVFDRLRDIRLVDLPARELIERLNQGKVYLPEQATHALQAFFSPSNLAALRELAMQTAADHVEEDLRESQIARGLPGIALRNRVLIAIDGMGASEYMVRAGRRIAQRRDAPWTVVTVQSGKPVEAVRQAELDRAFALARSLGADAEVVHGTHVADALLDHAERCGASTLIVGRTRERPLARMINRTLTQQLLQRGAHYELVIISSPEARARARRRLRIPDRSLLRHDLTAAVLATLGAIVASWMAQRWLGIDDMSMVFIVAVILVATRTSMLGVVGTAALCFFSYNFFFIEPTFTFSIGANRGVATVVIFLVAALVCGSLATRLRAQILALRAVNAQATMMERLGRGLSSAADLGQVLHVGRIAMERSLGVSVWIQSADRTEQSPGTLLHGTDRAAADWSLAHRQQAGRFTDTLAASPWWFVPLLANRTVVGVMGLRWGEDTARLAPEQRRLAEAMIDDVTQAIMRTRLVADLEGARVSNETERLRSALLSSVSHDLRSPLASMIGSASSLVSYPDALSAEDKANLLDTILEEGDRLDRYIQNLLDMTRLGHDGLTLNRDWVGVDELIGSASGRLRRYQPGVKLDVAIAADVPPIWVHPALVEQGLFNVLENAARFSPPGAAVDVSARLLGGNLQIDVRDRGPGIPEDERKRIFDMFYSVERGDRNRKGTGLGLTIAQGMIGAHGGSVEAFAGPDGVGTVIRITLPMLRPTAA
ncbi:histidine kinase [Stenotrophomonas sp. ZAC14D2_NAIMI4_7]|uniref:sensor histidine kinase n=1 Tax=Stenotrophomonas sp. ZAC14D2_NAIMI4_7 TaxID=2072405 RepID=UPI000D53FE9A|nr:sensor histidine kinase KdpD [Stenotrophomonas sp. ZAC14D2_NAIMI4_7]AWH18478.1 histidine kinase [Stenotrophomonas sp. ZAC14D2_NAIMI4_7]